MLTSDRSERVTGEPSGAPETLWGRIEPGAFGDRAHRSRPAELDERMKKSKEKRKNAAGGMDQDDLDAYAAKRKRRGTERASVLDAEADGSYRPKTRETRAAYEALLGMIQQQFGDQPRDVLRGAAEEVLEVLKDDASNDPKRKSDGEKLMGPTSDESFARMVAVGKLVTDFKPGGAGDEEPRAAPSEPTGTASGSAATDFSARLRARARASSAFRSFFDFHGDWGASWMDDGASRRW